MHSLPPSPPPIDEDCRWLLAGEIAAGCFLMIGNAAQYSFAISDTTSGNIAAAVWGGVMLGQTALAALWLGLGPAGTFTRVASTVAAYLLLAGMFLVGVLSNKFGDDAFDDFNTMLAAPLLGIPLFIAAVAAPLWLLRLLLGCQVRREGSAAETRARQFTIGQLMTLTTFIAVLLGAGIQSCRLSEEPPVEFWLMMGGWSLAFFFLSSVILFPAALLLSRFWRLGLGILSLATAIVYGLVVWFFLALASLFGNSPDQRQIWTIVGMCACPFAGFLLTLLLPILGIRKCGYRLAMRSKSEKKVPST